MARMSSWNLPEILWQPSASPFVQLSNLSKVLLRSWHREKPSSEMHGQVAAVLHVKTYMYTKINIHTHRYREREITKAYNYSLIVPKNNQGSQKDIPIDTRLYLLVWSSHPRLSGSSGRDVTTTVGFVPIRSSRTLKRTKPRTGFFIGSNVKHFFSELRFERFLVRPSSWHWPLPLMETHKKKVLGPCWGVKWLGRGEFLLATWSTKSCMHSFDISTYGPFWTVWLIIKQFEKHISARYDQHLKPPSLGQCQGYSWGFNIWIQKSRSLGTKSESPASTQSFCCFNRESHPRGIHIFLFGFLLICCWGNHISLLVLGHGNLL